MIRCRRWCRTCGVLLLALSACRTARGDSADERFLDGLRARRLFRLAEAYCDEQLLRSDLPGQRRAELSVELSRTLTEQALHTPPVEADPLWARAYEVAGTYCQEHPAEPAALLVRTQGALVLLARGEMLREQAQLAGGAQGNLAEVRGYLRTAIRELSEVAEQIELALHGRGPPVPRGAEPLEEAQLLGLQSNVRYQLARGLRNQGQTYPAGSADRADALSQAQDLLDQVAGREEAAGLVWSARLDTAQCARLAGNYEAARELLAALLRDEPPDDVRRRATAEVIRLATDRGDLDDAVRLAAGAEADAALTGDLALARVEALVAAWRAAAEEDTSDAGALESQAAEAVEQVARTHGPYWRRRAEAVLATAVSSGTQAASLTVLVAAAEGMYRAGQLEEAVAAYDRARQQAADEENADESFRLAYAAAAIEHERGRWREAVDRLQAAALAQPDYAQAAEAHLLAAHDAAQLARQDPAAVEEYAGLLAEHIERWNESPTADEARWLLGRLREAQRAWEAALAAYRAVTIGAERHVEALAGAARCYGQSIAALEAARRPTEDAATDAAEWFETFVPREGDDPPPSWTPAQRAAALHAARLWMTAVPDSYARAERVLHQSLADATDADPAWLAEAQCLLVAALAGSGQFDEADELSKSLPADPVEPLRELLSLLSAPAQSARGDDARRLADLQLRVAELAGGGADLDADAQKQLALSEARSLVSAGRGAEALPRYARLADDYPDDGQVQEEYARLLLDEGQVDQARQRWAAVERRSRPGTPRFFRARYYLALAHHRAGDDAPALRLIRLTRATWPELGDDDWRAKFEELEQECRE
jgi:hypothetical protein